MAGGPLVPVQGNTDLQGATGNVLVVNADGSLNVDNQAAVSTSGTLQNAAAANGAGTPLNVLGDASAVLTVNMSGFTGTVNFEGSEDGTDFGPMEVGQLGTNTVGTTAVGSTTTSITQYGVSVSDLQKIQARISGYSAGTVTVTAHALALPVSVEVVDANLDVAGQSVTAPADSQAIASTVPAVDMVQTGTSLVSPQRVPTKFIQFKAVAVTAGTPVSSYTPTSGKKWRVLSYHLSLSVAGSIIFEDTTGAGNEFMRTPLLTAGQGQASPSMGNGYLSLVANNVLFIDVTASGNVSGWIGIMEE